MTNREAERATDTLHDNKVPGLVLYVGAKCKTFYLYRRVYGQPQRIKLGRFPAMTVEQARKRALAVNAEIEGGTFGKPTTFGELWKLYCEVKRTKRTLDQDEFNYDHYLKAWAGRRLDTITEGDCQRLHSGKSGAPILANRVRALLSTVFNIAVKHGLRKDNPVRAVNKNPERSRERFLTNEELPKFFTALQTCEPDFRDMLLLCLYTGARVGNVLKMDDEQIEGPTWTIPRTKNGRSQQVHLCPEALAVIQGRGFGRHLPAPSGRPGAIHPSCAITGRSKSRGGREGWKERWRWPGGPGSGWHAT
jgi:integrase